jgi:hypothetical protein
VTYRRFLYAILAIGLLASLFVAVRRERHEHAARSVEIVMDDSDFSAFARSYGYDEPQFLIALRRAGLTSLAVSEELGGNVSNSSGGAVYSGASLLAQARITPLTDPLFARLARTGGLHDDEMYLIAYDAPTAKRYAQQLALKFAPHAVRLVRATLPATWAIHTQSDFFATEGLGLPYDRMALAKRLGLRLVPRLQNDETFTPATIGKLIDDSAGKQRATVAIFFGLRNEVLGYPNNYDATADALNARHLNFGTIESYDPKQEQLGNAELARKMPEHLVRVQAIAKVEADKLTAPEIVARYLLGVNERNIRVVYLRPYAHEWDGRSIEATNVEIVKQIADGIRKSGKRVGTASPFSRFVVRPIEIVLASLAVPAILLILLATIGGPARGGSYRLAAVCIAIDLLLVAAGYVSHHDLIVRKLLALLAGLAFPTAAAVAIGWAFRDAPGPVRATGVYARGVLALVVGIGVTLGGALAITGLLSSPLTMTEIEQFAGVKYVLFLPALAALALYFTTDCFGARLTWRTAIDEPVRVAQLLLGIVLLGGAYVVLQRSGNQSDIAPSDFELALRSHLTTILQVRPRFKEFAFAFPALMLVPALVPADKRRFGWLFVLAAGLGFGDVIDTFSHLHTPLRIGIERVGIGAVLGAIIGLILIALYRRLRPGVRFRSA